MSSAVQFDDIQIPKLSSRMNYGGRARWREYTLYSVRCALFRVPVQTYDTWVRHHRELAVIGAFAVAKRMRIEGYGLRDALALCTGRVHK